MIKQLNRSAAIAVSLLVALAGAGLAASPAQAALTYFYAGGYQTWGSAPYPNGISANIVADNVQLAGTDFHSLMEITAEQGSGANRQIIEVGFNVNPALYGDSNPHVFVGCWLNNSFGGYNTCIHGGGSDHWVDLGSNSLDAGDTLTTDQAYTFRIQYDSTDCGAAPNGWWVSAYVQGGTQAFIGCFMDTKWSNAGVTFTTATRLQAFGELAADTSTPCSAIGANPGVLATASTGATIGSVSIPNLGSGAVNIGSNYAITNGSWYNAVLATGSVRTLRIGGDPC